MLSTDTLHSGVHCLFTVRLSALGDGKGTLSFQIGGGMLIFTALLATLMLILTHMRNRKKAYGPIRADPHEEETARINRAIQSANSYGATGRDLT